MMGGEEGDEELEEDDPDLKDEPILKVDLHVSIETLYYSHNGTSCYC